MNTVAYDIYLLVTGGAVAAVMVWTLHSGLRTGVLPIRFGAVVRRREQPLGFWFTVTLMVALLIGCCVGIAYAAMDLTYRG
jgi:hypothetical protein